MTRRRIHPPGGTALLVLLSAGCGRPGNPGTAAMPPPEIVAVEIAERRTVPVLLELDARVDAAATVEVRANVEGRLLAMSFQEGRIVQGGQLLFRIDPRRYEAAVELAGAAVEKAEADLEMAREQQHLVHAQSALRQAEAAFLIATQDAERMKPLAARRAVPQRDLDTAVAAQSSASAAVEDARATVRTTAVGDRVGLRQAQANLTGARAALHTAELDREGTEIKAPVGGLIGRQEVSVGNYVGRGEPRPLAIISQVDPIDVVFNISEALYLQTTSHGIRPAALNSIELILADKSVYPFRGRFTSLGRAMDAKTGTVQGEAQFPNPKGILMPGMNAQVRMAGGDRPDAVLVSGRAVFDAAGSKAVYIVTSENRVAMRNISTEGSYQGKSIVTKGLNGGEYVIVEGIAKISPGQPVATRMASASGGA